MTDFSMDMFLGKWYAIQKTSTSSRCLEYNFEKTDEPNSYKLDQVSENSIIGVAKANNYHYIGSLKSDPSLPSRMIANFPLSVAGKASFVVFSTDYRNYAGIYSCQKIPLGNRHSVTILSRSRTLDKQYVDKVRNRIASSNVNPFDLTIVNQNDCSNLNSTMRVEINGNTFSSQNIGEAVRKVGSKIGDGVEYVINGGKKIYKSVSNSETKGVPDNEAEWMP
jgi:apolipoprotein D and lipocalin family protein